MYEQFIRLTVGLGIGLCFFSAEFTRAQFAGVRVTGFPYLLESLEFFLKFPGPGKSRKMGLVLESLKILVQGPGKSYNF